MQKHDPDLLARFPDQQTGGNFRPDVLDDRTEAGALPPDVTVVWDGTCTSVREKPTSTVASYHLFRAIEKTVLTHLPDAMEEVGVATFDATMDTEAAGVVGLGNWVG